LWFSIDYWHIVRGRNKLLISIHTFFGGVTGNYVEGVNTLNYWTKQVTIHTGIVGWCRVELWCVKDVKSVVWSDPFPFVIEAVVAVLYSNNAKPHHHLPIGGIGHWFCLWG
jgi:hypothetical protein